MLCHLIQSREPFGPEDRQEELRSVWRRNAGIFDLYSHPPGRPSFAELFAMCKADCVNCIANSDIAFDETIRLAENIREGQVYALSRWDVPSAGPAALWDHADSQDTYIVRGGPHIIDAHTAMARKDGEEEEVDIPFTQGVAGCDNRLLHVLRAAGYKVTNPSKSIRTYHLHTSQYRSYVDGAQGNGRGGKKLIRIRPPFAFEAPHAL